MYTFDIRVFSVGKHSVTGEDLREMTVFVTDTWYLTDFECVSVFLSSLS